MTRKQKELAERLRALASAAEERSPTGAVGDLREAYLGGVRVGMQMAFEDAAKMVEATLRRRR